MWIERHRRVCGKHPDLVAVYESPRGRLALLLRHTFVPLPEERTEWLDDTRRTARGITDDLVARGLASDTEVLQWSRPGRVAWILARWACRYDADPARRRDLADIVRARLMDGEARAPRALPPAGRVCRERPAARGSAPDWRALRRWYSDMVPCWLGVEPPVRRHVVLTTHRWVVAEVIVPTGRWAPRRTGRLPSLGRLAWSLLRAVPPGELGAWKPWISLVLTDLERALAWPADQRSQEWARWLFLIPYSIPAPSSVTHPTPGEAGRAVAAGAL